ncbi:MAG: menaquinone biosynthesis protein [Acidobacteria bacterium]|nr:menaquinone biosynthesis protein [Acidobacteriota bacterium]
MSRPVRLGAVNYLNVRPLVYGLDARPAAVSLRFDSPADCARLLAAGAIDLGMIPSIAYLDRPSDRVVPGVCIGADGPVASVALFTRRPVPAIATIALDTSSRTSSVLLRILCARAFGIAPAFVPHAPDLTAMLAVADAALLIGDPALFVDQRAFGAEKIDLGEAWRAMTGLPFVFAFWAGPDSPDVHAVVPVLQRAADAGMRHTHVIAKEYCASHPEDVPLAQAYLERNLMFHLDERALAGLRTYYAEAAALGLIRAAADLSFFAGPGAR